MTQFNPWKNNNHLFLSEIFLLILFGLQVSNSYYYCYSDDFSECQLFHEIDSAQCETSGLLEGTLPFSGTSVTVLCPWRLFQIIKAFLLMICAFSVLNWCLYKLLQLNFEYLSISCRFIVIVGLLLMMSGIADIVYLGTTTCYTALFDIFSDDHTCNQFWFYLNAFMEIFSAVFLILGALRLKNVKKPDSQPKQQGGKMATLESFAAPSDQSGRTASNDTSNSDSLTFHFNGGISKAL